MSESLYEGTYKRVKRILKESYKMTESQAKKAIKEYNLEEFFIRDEEMASHDSNESWARRIFDFCIERNMKD